MDSGPLFARVTAGGGSEWFVPVSVKALTFLYAGRGGGTISRCHFPERRRFVSERGWKYFRESVLAFQCDFSCIFRFYGIETEKYIWERFLGCRGIFVGF